MKNALQEAAHSKNVSVAQVLERIVSDWLEQDARERDSDEAARQRKLHEAAAETFGSIRGGDPDRSEKVRERIRARLRIRHGR